jgi:serpin B
MLFMKRCLPALLAIAVLVSACSAAPGSPGPSALPAGVELVQARLARAVTSAADAESAARAINALGLDLIGRIGSRTSNLVFSPSSIAVALAMARAGARGETAVQMDLVLRSLGADDHAAAANALDAALNGRSGTFKDGSGKSLDVALRIANTAFGQRGMAIAQGFLDALASRYGAGLHLVDYRSDPEAARQAINAWVDGRTEHRIKELLAPGVISPMTRLTLVNAIYLKAPWLVSFTDGATQPGPFARPDGSTVQAQLMRRGGSLPYAEGTGWRAVELPYVGGSLAMTVVVPDDLGAFEASLNAGELDQLVSSLGPRAVDLTFPRFGIETSAGLAAILADLGMPLAFDPDRADFSGITTAEQLFISAVVHQANIDVDEKGTEAAAATAVVMDTTSVPADPVTLRVDRPFLFLLRDVPTGAIVFMGRVVDPTVR